jgi:hypothetical protein
MLSNISKSQLTHLLTVLQNDAAACAGVHDAARRSLGPNNDLEAILGMTAGGVPRPEGQSALAALLEEVAAS